MSDSLSLPRHVPDLMAGFPSILNKNKQVIFDDSLPMNLQVVSENYVGPKNPSSP